MAKLHEELSFAYRHFGEDFYKNKTDKSISDNLRFGSQIRPYQNEAFGRFIYYLNEFQARPKGVPIQLLFHMATGSGKTLIMAGLILYLYSKGYRNFLFVVNSSNIINKTRDNFLNPGSPKYLFSDNTTIGGKQVRIKEVENFQAANQEDINVMFSTIQMLHIRMNMPKENSITYEDLEEQKIVLISDEAHHINVDTRRANNLSSSELIELESWETTVNQIFRSNKENILLEFTATTDFEDVNIAAKYEDKIVFDYPLRQFRIDGYSKEVQMFQTDLEPFDRALQAIILSQYRRKIFEEYKKRVKPVILFKSKTIKESEEFYSEFLEKIKALKESDVKKVELNTAKYESNQLTLNFGKSNQILSKAFEYFRKKEISLENLASELKNDFSESNCIVVNSKDESYEKQIAINTLEDENNEYRAVFAVDKLNEGWDVLNLYDIVRLYDTRDFNKNLNKPGKTTMSEAQLIGRGARYYPFQISHDQELYKRKYDFDINHELKICEELYYHSAYNTRYITELNWALQETGMKEKNVVERKVKLKDSFSNSDFFKTALIYLNELQKFDGSKIFNIGSEITSQEIRYHLRTGLTQTTVIYEDPTKQKHEFKVASKTIRLIDLGLQIIRKAIDKLEFYRFSNLSEHFQNLSSITEFITSENYLGKVNNIVIEGTKEQLENLTPDNSLNIAMYVLQNLAETISQGKVEYQGSKKFNYFLLKDRLPEEKVLNFSENNSPDKESGKSMKTFAGDNIYLNLDEKDWFVFDDSFGTSEEKHFIVFIDKVYENLKKKYDEIYLVRNERFFKLYNFDDGRATEPDFVLYMVNKKIKKSSYYQIFIEPKGDQFKDSNSRFENSNEGWKEKFLIALKEEHKLEQLFKDKDYIIWGMPFFNKNNENDFNKVFIENFIS